jgi:anti-anti-sigma factor
MKSKERLEVAERGGVVVASFLGPKCLGEEAIANLRLVFGRLAGGPQAVMILDCSRLGYLDSGSLKFVIRLHKVLHRRGGGLTLCGLHPTLAEVFRITRLDRVVPVKDSVGSALEGLSPHPAEPLPPCSLCPWPRQGRCLLCREAFCEEHGSLWSRLCRRHRWVGWLAAVALLVGLVLAGVFLRG